MTDYYINADSGDDGTGTGAEGNPWETLAYAYTQAIADDTIVCQDSVAIYAWVNQTFSFDLTIQGESEDASGAVFDAGGLNVGWINNSDLIVENCTFQNLIKTSAVSVFRHGTSDTFINCKFSDITIAGSDSGFLIGHSDAGSYAVITLTRCLFDKIDSINSANYLIGIYLPNISSALTLSSCTFFSSDAETNPMDAVYAQRSGVGYTNVIKNCIFATSALNSPTLGKTLVVFGSKVTYTIDYSCLYGVSVGSGTPTETGVITSDPLFVDAPNGYYNLRSASPCIDTGVLV